MTDQSDHFAGAEWPEHPHGWVPRIFHPSDGSPYYIYLPEDEGVAMHAEANPGIVKITDKDGEALWEKRSGLDA